MKGMCLAAFVAASPAWAVGVETCRALVERSRATSVSLDGRGRELEACLPLVGETMRAGYETAHAMCRGIALGRDLPVAIELRPGVTIAVPRPGESWEDLALRLGEDASTSGCRDGILAALVQHAFVDTARVREIFENSEMAVDDLFVGTFDGVLAGPLGELDVSVRVERSTSVAHLLDVGDVATSADGRILLQNAGFIMTGTLRGKAAAGFFATRVQSAYSIIGKVEGEVDPATLTATVRGIRIDSVSNSLGELHPELMSELQRSMEENLADGGAVELSRLLTDKLRESYAKADPFLFLHEVLP